MTAVPSAQGALQQTPLLHLLVYALDRRLNGTLVLEEPSHRKHAVLFVDGLPNKARPAEPARLLGELLVDQGVCKGSAITTALEQGKAERRLLGEVLLARGDVDERALSAALSEQVCRNVLAIAALPSETAFGFYEGVNYLERWGGARGAEVSPLALIWRVASAHADPAQVAHWVDRLDEGPLRLHVDAPLSLLGLDSRSQSAVDVLRAKPQPVAELIGRELCDRETTRRLIYALLLLRYFQLPGSGAPIGVEPSASPRPPSVPPRARTPPRSPRLTPQRAPRMTPAQPPTAAVAAASSAELEERRAEITRRASETGVTYYALLGVPTDAPAGVIQNAFFQLAKSWHPDRLPGELADLREAATRVFSRMSEAHQTLTDPERRREYDASSTSLEDAADQEHVQRVLRAHNAYQKAVVLLKRNAHEAAEVEARRAAEEDPDQADYIGLVAWIESFKAGVKVEPLVAELDRAVRMEENNLRVRWFRGQLLKRVGRDNRALADFRFILEREPKHVDAQREVRLFEMRRGSSSASKSNPPPPNEKSGGVFGRLFKKP